MTKRYQLLYVCLCCVEFSVKASNVHELDRAVFLSPFRVHAATKCFCSVLTLCWLHREVLHCCCQLPQHFCGFNRPLCRHSASFEVRWVSQDFKNTQDTFLLSFFTKMWCRCSPAGSSGVSLARRTGAWLGRETHLWSVVSLHDHTWPQDSALHYCRCE